MSELEVLHPFFALVSFLLGSIIGSFLNVVVYRMPRGLSVVKPRSKCPNCEKPVMWYDNVPVFSWLLLRAKCRFCGEPISWQYPLVEGITGLLFLGVYLRFGFTLATPIYMLLVAGLVVVTFVDLVDWTIPNEITYPGIPLGIVCAGLATIYPASNLQLQSIVSSVAGAAMGYLLLKGLDMFSLIAFKKHGMGMGDWKLMAMLGAFFGFANTILIIALSSFVGIALASPMIYQKYFGGDEDENPMYLPFGPSIAIADIIAIFCGPQLIQGYLEFVGAVPQG